MPEIDPGNEFVQEVLAYIDVHGPDTDLPSAYGFDSRTARAFMELWTALRLPVFTVDGL
jgi:hypothetical protein